MTAEPGHAAALKLLPVVSVTLMGKSKVATAPGEVVIEIVLGEATVRLRGEVERSDLLVVD